MLKSILFHESTFPFNQSTTLHTYLFGVSMLQAAQSASCCFLRNESNGEGRRGMVNMAVWIQWVTRTCGLTRSVI